MEIKQQIKQLRAQLQKAGYAYYVDNQTRLDTMIFSIPRTFTLLRRPYLLLFSTTVLLAAQAAPIYCLSTPQQANQRWEERDYKGAIEDFNEAIRLDPNNAIAYYNRGVARYSFKDYQGAIEDFRQAANLSLEQGNIEQYQNALNLLQQLRN